MNKRRLRALARFLRKIPKRPERDFYGDPDFKPGPQFDMGTWFKRLMGYDYRKDKDICGTAGCIAGWACQRFGGDVDRVSEIDVCATELLGLDTETASKLFTPYDVGLPVEYDKVTPKTAARVLERLADTGEVKWPKRVRPDDWQEPEDIEPEEGTY